MRSRGVLLLNNVAMKRFIKVTSWCVLFAFIAICAYYAVLNAAWLIGDDAMVIKHTGIGKLFYPSEYIWPESGRFFPFAYLMYNILPIFFDGWISPQIIYSFHSICFSVGMLLCMFLLIRVQNDNHDMWKYAIALLGTVFLGTRMYHGVVNCFSTVWFDTFTQPFTVLFFILFCQTKNNIYGLLSLLMIIWCTYCSEIGFALPLVLGICGLIFRWKEADYKEKTYYWLIVANATIFLLIYLLFIRTKTEISYDPSHGSGVTFLGNIIYIIRSQKLFWVAIPLICVRIWDVLYRKSHVTVYDILSLAAAGHCCACFILKLDWTLYYYRAYYFLIPSIIYYCNYYINSKATFTLMLVLASFYCSKIPNIIVTNQQERKSVEKFVSCIVDAIKNKNSVYWYAPNIGEANSFEFKFRDFTEDAIQACIGYELGNMDFRMIHIEDYNGDKGYYLLPIQNEEVKNGINAIIYSNGTFVTDETYRNIKLYRVD